MSLLVHIGVVALLLSFTFTKVEGDGPTIAVELLAEKEPPTPEEEPPLPPKPKQNPRALPTPPVSNPHPPTTASLALTEVPPPPQAVGEPAAAHATVVVAANSIPAPTAESIRQSYAQTLWRHILLFKPLKLRAEGTAQVSFTLSAEGRLISCEISNSSGNTRLDEAALESLRRAQPFPPRPPGLGLQPLSFAIPFEFTSRSP